jgi:hypothetical protein
VKIHGFTVSVDYADLLAPSVDRWLHGLDGWVVITTPDDQATQRLCARQGITLHRTRAFYDDGTRFNKAKAMAEAYDRFPPSDWVLLIDADVIPPDDWRARVDQAAPEPGKLYGAGRRLESGSLYREGEIAGYFQLFHASDRNVQRRPVFDCTWRHAGGYDSEFQFRWKADWRRYIPGLELVHQGEPGQNWFGRGRVAEMDAMLRRRLAAGGVTKEERL